MSPELDIGLEAMRAWKVSGLRRLYLHQRANEPTSQESGSRLTMPTRSCPARPYGRAMVVRS